MVNGLIVSYICGGMFKRLVVVFLLFALIASHFSVAFTYVGFEANQKELAQRFCENKSRPWMHCNGKCYLLKKLKQAEEKEKKQERDNLRNAYQLAMPVAVLRFSLAPAFTQRNYPSIPVENPVGRSLSIFQPPKLSV